MGTARLRAGAPRTTRMALVAALAALVGVASCAGPGECQPGQACEVRGYILVGPEVWAFQRCGSAALISIDVKGDEAGIEKLNEVLYEAMGCTEDPAGTWTCSPQSSASVYAAMTATISAGGRYGHLGKYERELQMLQIHEASSAAPSDCAKVDPVFP